MFKNYLLVAYRNLVRYKTYSIINITGLAIGIAFCILTFLYVRHEWSYDAFHNNADRIHRVYMDFQGPDQKSYRFSEVTTALRNKLPEAIPGIEQAVRLIAGRSNDFEDRQIQTTYQGQIHHLPFLIVDNNFFDVFTFPFQFGDPENALKDPHSIVLSAETAEKLFGNDNPLGKQVTLKSIWSREKANFTITGVTQPLPETSSIQFDMVLPYKNLWFFLHEEPNAWKNRACDTYIQLAENTTSSDVEQALPAIVKAHLLRPEISENSLSLKLQTLTSLHHRTDFMASTNHGTKIPIDPIHGYGLVCISVLVLIMASINFINLSIGRLVTRTKEVGVRKVVGAIKTQLIGQFLSESVLLTIITVSIGLVLAEQLLPAFNNIMHHNLSFQDIFSGSTFLFLFCLSICLGLLVGCYPALILAGLHPIRILTGRFNLNTRNTLGRGLVFIQFALSSFLIICTLIMIYQLQFINDKNIGFNKSFVISIRTDELPEFSGQHKILKEQYLQYHKVVSCTAVRYALLDEGWQGWAEGEGEKGQTIRTKRFYVDYDFIKTFEMKISQGRDFNANTNDQTKGRVLVNETLVKTMGWDNPIGQTINFGPQSRSLRKSNGIAEVVGVVQDFNLMPLQQKVKPATILLNASMGNEARHFFVRVQPQDMTETLQFLEDEWKKIAPNKPFHFSFLDDDIANYYKAFFRWSKITAYATIFAVFIACLGAFGLTALAVARRTKEIGIRKVMGASVFNIVFLLAREFIILVLIATLCAWPVAYLTALLWLQDFAYRMDLTAGVFVLGGILTLTIVIGTVSIQALKAAKTNPVDTLRYE